jgi:CBS domain-containing protein
LRAWPGQQPGAKGGTVREASGNFCARRRAPRAFHQPARTGAAAGRLIRLPTEEAAMNVREVMTPNPRTVELSDTIQDAARIMREEDTGAVPVVEDGRVVGMVTDRDIVIRAVADGDFEATIDDIVTDDVVCATPDMSTADAAELMGEHQIRRLPVVDEDENILGIVSLGDLAVKEGRDARMGETLENISEGVKRH